MIGILFGHAYTQIGKDLNYYAAGVSVLFLIFLLILFIKKYKVNIRTTPPDDIN